ncbi:hypothetical protein [Sphingomonas sp. CARO-RG-8B-R24-01]|uniref:hypothetical protein n=1 Tax=Sphingomonas sp. CARO-RG-8B-R24-01 TaxID=2914831 RepID=UPI001F57CF50|nr:hypothetical protein [Sphingomonas sp. CARO-RG-8B-R24-01]
MRMILLVLFAAAGPAVAADVPEQRTVTAGDVVWSSAPPPAVHYEVVLDQRAKGGSLISSAGLIDVPAGTTLDFVETPSGMKACSRSGTDSIFGRERTCLIDENEDGAFDRYSFNETSKIAPLKSPAKYTKRTVTSLEGPAFERRIIYLGSTPTTLSLSYREFGDSLARSAFTENLTIPLGTAYPQIVRFKGLEMEIANISGMGMRYSIKPIPAQP